MAGTHYAFDAPHAPMVEAGSTHIPSTDTGSTMYAAPVASVAPAAPVMPAAPPPVGPLPAYGSDLRPPTVAAPAVSPPAAAMPASAPVNPASGTGAANQPVVRQVQPTAAPTAPATPGLTENAVAAASVGATAGIASAQAVAHSRLVSLVESVARQEPLLSWAVGDLDDDTTVLATDLASGWIPPHVEIPSGVRLLAPGTRRSPLEALLGETTDTAIWTPGHYLPDAKDADPVPTWLRARQVPEVDDLNWELTQATNWRDGLPRLAHTLAKAGIAGTGVLDSEVDLLREHLDAVRSKVLRGYPDRTDAEAVGNWQLLAAIDALVTGYRTELNYHFAWFQALSMTKLGGQQ